MRAEDVRSAAVHVRHAKAVAEHTAVIRKNQEETEYPGMLLL